MSRTPSRTIFSRRTLLKAAPAALAGAAAGGLGWMGSAQGRELRLKGVCRICTMHCHVVGRVRGNHLLHIEGDMKSSSSGFVCHHGYALPEIVHSEARLTSPLKRVGDAFTQLSWEDALGEIAQRLLAIKAQHGPEAVALHTGWPFVRHPIIPWLHRFAWSFGTPNVSTVASLCEAALRMGKSLVAGANFHPDFENVRTLFVWGANPTHSMPLIAHLATGMSANGKTLVVVDPVRTELAAMAHEHLQVLPGTDGALALGMMRVLVDERLVDEAYVERETLGYDELRALVQRYDLERVEAITTVPREQIVRAARLLATQKPAAVLDGLGIEHHANGIQTVRAVASLQALCGLIDVKGGAKLMQQAEPEFYDRPIPVLFRFGTPEPVPPRPRAEPIGRADFPLFDIYNKQSQGNLYVRAMLEDKPYPLRGLILLGCNAFVTWPGSQELRRAADKLDLLVSIDPFLTTSGELSDYVLPAATFAEWSERGNSSASQARSGLVPEQHDAWPDWKVIFELARALGLGSYFPWEDFGEAITAPHVPFMRDPEHTLMPQKPAVASAPPRFPSTSGKLELASPVLKRFGYDPLPDWKEPPVRPTAEHPLVLVTGGRTRAHINSQFHQIPSIVRMMPEPYVELHPTAAAAAGVGDGEHVSLVSPHGRVSLRCKVTERVHPRTAVLPAGWPQASANELTDGTALDPISGFPAVRSAICRVEKLVG